MRWGPGGRCLSPRDTEEARLSPPGGRRGQGRLLRRRGLRGGMSLVCGWEAKAHCYFLPQAEEVGPARKVGEDVGG